MAEAQDPGVVLDSAATPNGAVVAAAARALHRPEGRGRGQPPGDPVAVASGLPFGSDNLVIGIGNALRGDDGVAGWLAQRAEQWLPAAQLRTVQQLTPELAEDIAAAARVLFIDAWIVPNTCSWLPSGEEGADSTWAGRPACGAALAGLNDQPQDWNGGMVASRLGVVLHCLQPTGRQPTGLQPTGLQSTGLQPPYLRATGRHSVGLEPEVLLPAWPAGDSGGVPHGAFSHQLSPSQLLRISELLFEARPEAWQLLVPAFCLDHGEGFSQRLCRLLPGAERLLRQWIHCGDAIPTAGRA